VYVSWYSGNNSYLKTSTDGGWTWGQPLTITGQAPAIAVDVHGDLHISYWHSDTVYYIRSTDGGLTFTPPLSLGLSLGQGCPSDIAVDANGHPYVVWQETYRKGGLTYPNILLTRPVVQGYDSTGVTATLTTTIVGTTTDSYAQPPKVAVSPSGQNVYVTWRCPYQYYGNYVQIYFARSIDGGDTFGSRFHPTGSPYHGEYSPAVAAYGEDVVYVAWVRDLYLDRRTNFAHSENSGESFLQQVELGASGSDYDSAIAADALGQVCVAWRQNTQQDDDLYFRCSPNGGHDFSPARLLVSGPPGTSQYKPALTLWSDPCTTHLDAVWEDTRNGNRDILFSSLPVLRPVVGFSSPSYTVGEGDESATITVTLCVTSAETISVNYATSDGTALAGSDYVTASGTLTFAPGIASHTFVVPILDDTLDEVDETVLLTLSDPNNAVIASANPVTLTILDDDWCLYMPLILRNHLPTLTPRSNDFSRFRNGSSDYNKYDATLPGDSQ